ncbi:hypothetical protein ACG04Q_03720 [Roseateles sp. DXS20W]|uniref:Polysaccharide biosynthesis protein n=1 Tax=Pelomonas lactea TaxID=3299030 RepID=A0ABW7GFR3_9BURK
MPAPTLSPPVPPPEPQPPARAATAPNSGDGSYLAHRAVQLLGAGAMAFGATLWLPPAEAGFYFMLLSLLGAQALLDAGSSTVLLSFVARAMRHLHWAAPDRLAGSAAAVARLGDLTRLALTWAVASSALALALVLPLALLLLRLRPEGVQIDPGGQITVCTIAALALYQLGAALPQVLEGTGRVSDVARMRALLDVLAYTAAVACLLAGNGLWAPAVLWSLRGAGQLLWSLAWTRRLLGRSRPRWLRRRLACTMAPMQGRLALSWTVGFLGLQTMVPISYALLGPALTGRIGLGLFLANGVLMLATAPVSSRAPELGRLGAQRAWRLFDDLAAQALRRSLGLALAGHTLTLLGVAAAGALFAEVAERLPEPSWLAWLALSSLASTAIQAIATALRACGREPFLAATLWGAALLPPALLIGAGGWGAPGLCLAHLLLNGGLGLPWALRLRRRFRETR